MKILYLVIIAPTVIKTLQNLINCLLKLIFLSLRLFLFLFIGNIKCNNITVFVYSNNILRGNIIDIR